MICGKMKMRVKLLHSFQFIKAWQKYDSKDFYFSHQVPVGNISGVLGEAIFKMLFLFYSS